MLKPVLKETDQQNPRKNGEGKPIQTKSHKEAYTYALTISEKGGRKYIYIYKRKTASKLIKKSTNDNKFQILN